MSTPIAIAADLGVYLENPNIDTPRATLILGLAQSLCESIVTPLPDTALAVVLGVAARAFNNVASAAAVGIGSGHITYGTSGSGAGIGGLYLSRSDIRTLRLLGPRWRIQHRPDTGGRW
jgi:hypothetical protein